LAIAKRDVAMATDYSRKISVFRGSITSAAAMFVAMFVGDRTMASTSLAGAAAVFPACTATAMRPHPLRARMHCIVGCDRNAR